MPKEIEKKFLVIDNSFKKQARNSFFRQGYLSVDRDRTVRVRTYENKGFITIKGKTRSYTREEFEYEIPVAEAEEMLMNLCIKPIIEKIRYFTNYMGNEWVIDEFIGENSGLVVAEIELECEEQEFAIPEWLGREVTFDKRYANSNLILKPYSQW